MKKRVVMSLALGVALLPMHGWAAPPYDGNWSVTVDCQQSGQVRGYNTTFPGQVTNGVMHAQKGADGAPGTIKIDGKIMPDGSAALVESGWGGDARYVAGNPGTGVAGAFNVPSPSRFDATHGTGSRTAGRVCSVTFTKA
jgi:hypothetical protein